MVSISILIVVQQPLYICLNCNTNLARTCHFARLGCYAIACHYTGKLVPKTPSEFSTAQLQQWQNYLASGYHVSCRELRNQYCEHSPDLLTTFLASPDRVLSETDLKDLLEVLNNARAKWRLIGTQLEIHPGTLEAITLETTNDSSLALTRTLTRWLKRLEPAPTVRALAGALETSVVGEEKLSQQLQARFGRSSQ